ncbi:MAG: helix-hairpin-helix domain-containing protein [Gemmatimonadales bacterium]
MSARLTAFVESHPTGWNHDEWLALLADLGQGGTDVSNPDAIGAELEKARVTWELKRRGVPGLGRKRLEAIANRFGTVRDLQNATVDEMARVPGMTRALAEKVLNGDS